MMITAPPRRDGQPETGHITPTDQLRGLTVLDASTIIAGPLAASLLGEYGARVIKVENPAGGDGLRRVGTNLSGEAGVTSGPWWRALSRNKECVSCNLNNERGREVFRELARHADVVIENFRPGTLERWQLDPTTLTERNPNLVVLRVTGFGQDGPYSARPGYGTLAEAMSGLANLTGFPDGPPVLPGVPVADSLAGFAGATAVLAALQDRRDDGSVRAATIDLSLYGPLLYALSPFITETSEKGVSQVRSGSNLARIPSTETQPSMRDAVVCADHRWLAYSIVSPRLIRRTSDFLSDQLQLPPIEHPELHKAEVNRRIAAWARQRPRAEALREAQAAGVPMGPVYDSLDIIADEHFRHRGEFEAHSSSGGDEEYLVTRGPWRVDGVATSTRHPARATVGRDNDLVYTQLLGLVAEEIEALSAEGAI